MYVLLRHVNFYSYRQIKLRSYITYRAISMLMCCASATHIFIKGYHLFFQYLFYVKRFNVRVQTFQTLFFGCLRKRAPKAITGVKLRRRIYFLLHRRRTNVIERVKTQKYHLLIHARNKLFTMVFEKCISLDI